MWDYKARITATYLTYCSPDKAYDWLSDESNSLETSEGNLEHRHKPESGRKILEYLLLRRKNPLIDLGLAQFACTPHVLKTVFARGSAGIRYAVLSNPLLMEYSWMSAIDISEVVARGNRHELEALALNAYLPDGFYENLIKRSEYFAEINDYNYKFMLRRLGYNARLSTPYEETILDGGMDYSYHEVFDVAWGLCVTVPTNQEWAEVLYHLLHNAQPPVDFKELDKTIERWLIDLPRKESDSYHYTGYSFDLRYRLADLLEADEQLLNSPDLALRQSFYRRFSPWNYKNWPEFLEKDGKEFVREALQNLNLWKYSEERHRLDQVSWDCPDPNSSMYMPNDYKSRKRSLEKEHPEWFYDEDYEFSSDPRAVRRRTEKLLGSIDEKLKNLSETIDDSLPSLLSEIDRKLQGYAIKLKKWW